MTYCLVARILAIQFKNISGEHFSFHQFGVTICDGCEIVVHGVQTVLDLHLNWVVL